MWDTAWLLLNKDAVVIYIATHWRGMITELEEMLLNEESLAEYRVKGCGVNLHLVDHNDHAVRADLWFKENA